MNLTNVTSNNPSNCSIQIRIATQAWEKHEIYRLRHQVYVQEMAKSLPPTVNKNNQICDSLDNSSILLYAQIGHDMVGTMRINIDTAENYPANLAEIFQMHKFKRLSDAPPNFRLGLGTKLAVIAEYRNSPVLFYLLAEAYKIVRKQSIQFFFGGCNPSLISLYERIGFRRFSQNFADPGYGLLIPLVIVLEDIQHFKFIKSPIYRHARKYTNNPFIAQRFLQEFPKASQYLNTQLTSPARLWEYVESKLNVTPFVTPPFQNLNPKNIMDILEAGAIFHCLPGECLLQQGNLCNDLYILLSGTLLAKSLSTRILHPGACFGALSLLGQTKQNDSISVLSEADIFVLPHHTFTRYQHLHPQAAEIFLNNLAGRKESAYACASLTEQGGQHYE